MGREKTIAYKKAQAVIEYSLIFTAVVMAIVMMYNYFHYSVNARLKRTAVGLNDVFEEINK